MIFRMEYKRADKTPNKIATTWEFSRLNSGDRI